MFNKSINKLSKKIAEEIKCEELKEQLNKFKLNNCPIPAIPIKEEDKKKENK